MREHRLSGEDKLHGLYGPPGVTESKDEWMNSWEKQCSVRLLKAEKKAQQRFSKMQRRARQFVRMETSDVGIVYTN